jgi:hypothetical protein
LLIKFLGEAIQEISVQELRDDESMLGSVPPSLCSVITFKWVQQQTHPKVMTDMLN